MNRQMLGAVGLMFAAMSLIPMGDAAGKLLTSTHGVPPAFVALSRFAVGTALILLLAGGRVRWRLYRDWRVWLRGSLIAGGIACILTALRTEQFATVIGAFFIGPIFSFALSVRFLGERVSAGQTALLALGFCGVMLVVRPGIAMTPGLALAVAAGLFYGAFLTASRWLHDVAPPRQLMLSQSIIGMVLLAPAGLLDVPPVTPLTGALLLWSGLASACGNLILILAYRRAGAALLAPFVYLQLLSALALGWVVFGTLPDAPAMAGLLLIAASGFGTLALHRQDQPPPARMAEEEAGCIGTSTKVQAGGRRSPMPMGGTRRRR